MSIPLYLRSSILPKTSSFMINSWDLLYKGILLIATKYNLILLLLHIIHRINQKMKNLQEKRASLKNKIKSSSRITHKRVRKFRSNRYRRNMVSNNMILMMNKMKTINLKMMTQMSMRTLKKKVKHTMSK